MTVLERAMTSSVVVRYVRHVAAGSTVCATVAAATRWSDLSQWLRQTRRRIAVGAAGDWSDQQEIRTVSTLDALLANSRIAAAVSALVMAPVAALPHAGVRRMLDGVLSLDLPARIRTGSYALIVAVLCHTALLAALGVPVHVLGWSTRVALLAAGAIGFRYPEAFAAAWREKRTRRQS